MQLMSEGGRRELILPKKLGYDDPDAGSSIFEGVCELHNNDVLTEFKKPLHQQNNFRMYHSW